ncbi:MAG TPA: YtxH domain-containing protein [Puia sp.]|nr:YtxH domain-containing protein [Puia sp.]
MNKKFIAGILAGIGAGAILALMFAPEKGSRTRKKIFRKGQSLAENLKENFTEFIDQTAAKLDSVRKR